MLTDNLRRALEQIPMGAIPSAAEDKTVVVVKVSQEDAASFEQPDVRVIVTPIMAMYETGAVFMLYCQFNDRPDEPFAFDMYLNPAVESEQRLIKQLAKQEHLDFMIHDLALDYVFTKRIRWNAQTRADIAKSLHLALGHNADLEQTDYPASLEAVKKDYRLASLRK